MSTKTIQSEIKKNPELRFHEFKGQWKTKKLKDLFFEITNTVGDKDIETYSISAGKGFISQKEKFGRNISGRQGAKYIILEPNQFTYNKGNSKTFKYGCVYLNLENKLIAVPNVFISFGLINENDNPLFFLKLFESHYLDHGLKRIISSTSRSDGLLNVSKENFFNLEISLPESLEQKKISEFIESVDLWIKTLKFQRKLIESYKKGILQKIFSEEIKFKDERGKLFPEWEEKKLKEIVSIKTGKKDVNQGNPLGKYPFFTCAKTHTFSDSFSFSGDAIMIAGNGEVGLCLYYSGKFEAYQRVYVLQEFKYNAQYLFLYLDSYFKEFAVSKKQTGAMPYIKLGMLQDYKIPIPSEEEQKKIIEFLVPIDKLMESKQQQILSAEQWKKGLMQGLFI